MELRRGEQGDADEIGGGAEQEESRAICCALAVESWLSQAMNDLMVLLPPREPEALDEPDVVIDHRNADAILHPVTPSAPAPRF